MVWPMGEIFLFTRGVALGVLLLLCLKLWLDDRQLLVGRLLLAVMVGVACYVVLPFLNTSSWLNRLAAVPSILVPPLFWLFALALFQDWDSRQRGIGLTRLLLVLVFLAVAYAGYWRAHEGVASDSSGLDIAVINLPYLLRLVFILMALRAILSDWQGDLVEARRRLRLLLVAVGGGYILVVICVEIVLGFSPAPLWLEVGHSLLLVVMFIAIALWLMILSPDGLTSSLGVELATPVAAPPAEEVTEVEPVGLSVTEQGWTEQLQQMMEVQSGYHDSSLTIRRLAEQLAIPEHQLRRLINRHLGYRNFNDYLNHYRIGEAAVALADPARERLPILTIALEVGYGSLTPFNRAFKARYQQTPSEFRRAMAASQPDDSE